MLDPDRLLEAKFLHTIEDGSSRYRLPGAGRRMKLPPEVDMRLHVRLSRITAVRGGWSAVDFIRNIEIYSAEFAPNLNIIDGDNKTPPVPGKVNITVDRLFRHRWRMRWQVKTIKGDHQTALDFDQMLTSIMESQVKIIMMIHLYQISTFI